MSLETRSSRSGRPSAWAVSLLMLSIVAMVGAMSLLSLDLAF